MKKNKKANISVFIIIGLIILASVVSIMILKSMLNTQIPIMDINDNQDEIITSFVESCFSTVSVDGAYYIASHGGYYQLPSEHLEVTAQGQEVKTSYAFKNSQDLLISREDMEKEYSEYINEKLPECINGFQSFGYLEIKQGTPSAEVDILDDKVIIGLKYPIKINHENSVITIEDFSSIIVQVRLGKLHDLAKTLVSDAVEHPERGPNLNILSALSQDNMRAYYGWTEDSLYYIINDYDSSIQRGILELKPSISNQQYNFNFALKYK